MNAAIMEPVIKTIKEDTPFSRGDLVSKIGKPKVYVFGSSENGLSTIYGIKLSETADRVINISYTIPTDQLEKREIGEINVDGPLWNLMNGVSSNADIWFYDNHSEVTG